MPVLWGQARSCTQLEAAAGSRRPRQVPAAVVILASYLAGSVPFSNIVSRRSSGVDLRDVGTGTVSGTSLFATSGFGPLSLAGCCELAKGALGPLLARDRRALGSLATAAAIIGHDWSPWLGGQGGRGMSVLLGSSLVCSRRGAAVIGAGMGMGRVARHSALGTLVALVGFPFVARGRAGGLLPALSCVAPILVKRAMGNDHSWPRSMGQWVDRLLYDRGPLVQRLRR
ncbi:MAG: glycerol-3-phosphate acyltransferase [Acidimicrobiales bacterium]